MLAALQTRAVAPCAGSRAPRPQAPPVPQQQQPRGGSLRARAAATAEAWLDPPEPRAAGGGAQPAAEGESYPLVDPAKLERADGNTLVAGNAARNGHVHLPSSLYSPFPNLPPDGHTLTPKEEKCDPEMERCRTPIHVWESRCMACGGTGTQSQWTSRQRRLGTCLLCSGLGYVRHSSTHSVPHVNGAGPHTTIGRPPPPEPQKHKFVWPGRK